MNKLTQKFLVASLLALTGCERAANSGRLVGFIVDGQTGQRLNFFQKDGNKNNLDDDKDSQSQVYAVIDGEFRRAEPCGSGDANDDNGIEADGCFQIDGIPEGMTIPIFAQAPGYERFVGEYNYGLIDMDVEHSQQVANIRLFPKGFAVDYRFNVSLNNQPVSKAQVLCQYLPTSTNTLQVAGDFLDPVNTGTTTISATSGDDGVAVIPGAQLVNGATYHCEAVMGEALDGRTLSGQGDITAGVSQSEQRVALSASGATDALVYAVRSNADNTDTLMGGNGKLIISFNRPVEIVPGTADCQVATATAPDTDGDSNTGRLITDVRHNPPTTTSTASESVSAEISGDGLTLTVGFKAELPFDPDDRGTSIAFSGVVLR
ncbi:hypothetical protein, partial [Archangium sp.]|uniref:hypothetical protein n=1 Tax=Archangium sp. TaxID=1872627 RepID=UPI002ED88BAD